MERDDVTYLKEDTNKVHIGRCIDCLDNYIGVKVKNVKYDEKMIFTK